MSKLIESFTQFVTRVYQFVRYDVWRITENELTKSNRFLYRFVKTIIIAIRGFMDDQLNVKASALTYSILFAAVPLIALVLGISKGFGVEQYIKTWLADVFSGRSDIQVNIMEFVERYLDTTQGGLFIGIGIIILLWSVMSFFMQVETAFNNIWQVKKSRSIFRQFTIYFSSILILPVLIVASSGLQIYINTVLSQSFLFDFVSPFLRLLVNLSPLVLNWVVFILLYMLIPNTKVRFVNALIAGIFAATVFYAFQSLYISGQINLTRYNIVYGSFAAIPLLLLWLRISCLIVLLGAEVSYAMQNTHFFEYETDTKNISHRYKNFITLFVTHSVVKQFENQLPALSSEDIAKKYTLPIRLVNQVLTELVEVNILVPIYTENIREKRYQPSIDINQLTVSLLFDKLETHGSEMFLNSKNQYLDEFWNKLSDFKTNEQKESNDFLIKDIAL